MTVVKHDLDLHKNNLHKTTHWRLQFNDFHFSVEHLKLELNYHKHFSHFDCKSSVKKL